MKRTRGTTLSKTLWTLCFFFLPVLACGGQDQVEKKVLIIGIDGIRPDALLRAETNNLDRLMQNGAYSFEAMTDEISSSGPSWTAMLTGVWHDKHNVVSNRYEDPNLEAYPHFFRRIREEKPELKTYSVVNWEPIHKILEEQDANHASSPNSDNRVAAMASRLLKHEDVDAMFVQLDHVDHAGHTHDFSPDSEKYLRAIEKADRQAGRMIESLKKRKDLSRENWLIIVSTDHGGSEFGHGKNIIEHRTIFFISSGEDASRGEICGNVNVVDVAATALVHLGIPIRDDWNLDGKPTGLKGKGTKNQQGPDTRLNGWDVSSELNL
jgi:predicted AlkP superfamily pyrophosphatase or phosphodiesterase